MTSLERSIWNTDPLDEFACVIADFIWKTARDHPNIEIEAKIGTLINKQSGERVALPVLNETIVEIENINARFESSMNIKQHKGYNELLNGLATRTNKPDYPGAKVSYKHSREVDYFYSAQGAKIRVTKDEKTGEIKEGGVIQKDRLADLNVYCPQGEFDYRISVNVETPVEPPPPNMDSDFVRRKDRVSYAHQIVQVDLTQVMDPGKKEPTHELEVEFRDSNSLLQAASTTRSNGPPQSQDWSPYEDMVLIFLNNVRLLIKNCPNTNRG